MYAIEICDAHQVTRSPVAMVIAPVVDIAACNPVNAGYFFAGHPIQY
jgi:hypothetical protein